MGHLIEINQVTKLYNSHRALNNIDLSIKDNCIWGLLGPNGAGKSTLIRILNQIIEFDQGEILIDKKPLCYSHLKLFGYLPEERGMYKDIKIEDQLLYFAQLKGLSRNVAKENLSYWFNKFDIRSWKEKKISDLSKGMQQKVQFISSIIHRPKFLFLDEPFSGFDPLNSQIFKDEIMNLHKDEGCTIILSTHDMVSVEELCENIVLLVKSNIILNGKLSEIKEKYNDQNLFEILVQGDIHKLKTKTDINFSILHIKSSNDSHTINIRYTGEKMSDSNYVLKLLFNYIGDSLKILSYRFLTPSMEDIFISTVKNNNIELY